MSVNFRADRFKRTRLYPLRIDGLNPKSPMKPTIKDTAVIDNFESFLNVQGAIFIHCDLGIKGLDPIKRLRSGYSAAEEGTADEQLTDER